MGVSFGRALVRFGRVLVRFLFPVLFRRLGWVLGFPLRFRVLGRGVG